MEAAILGRKLGMTQVFDEEGLARPVTAIEAGPCAVLQVKTREHDGYSAIQVGFDECREKSLKKPQQGHFKKAGVSPRRLVREIRTEADPELKPGDTITLKVLDGVKLVDVSGVTKGRGFQGGMKRWGFHGEPASHGTEKTHRSSGSMGRAHSTRKGVYKGKKMPGRMGGVKRTVHSLQVVRLDEEKNLLLVQGGVPGPNGGYLYIRRGVKS